MKHTSKNILCGLGILSLLAACGGDEPGYDESLGGKADRKAPELLSWAPESLPLGTCALDGDAVRCNADRDFNPDPLDLGSANHKVAVSIQADPTKIDFSEKRWETQEEMVFPLEDVSGKIKIIIEGKLGVPHAFNAGSSWQNLEYRMEYLLSKDDEKASVDIFAPFDIWRVKLLAEDAFKLGPIAVKVAYQLEGDFPGTTQKQLNLNGEVELLFITDQGAEAINGKISINGTAVTIDAPGYHTVTLDKQLRATTPADFSF